MKTNKVFLTILLIFPLVLTSSVFLYKVRASASQTPAKPEAIKPALLSDAVSIHAAGRGNPAISLSDGHDIVSENVGAQSASAALDASTANPLGLASADFDEDGVPDLISAYAASSGGLFTLHRGNIDAVYPNSPQAQARKQRGEFSDAPFLSPATSFDLPQSPDFIGAGDFDADGHQDVVVASRGSNSLLFLLGDGHGGFGTTKQITLPGMVTALAAVEVNRTDYLADLVVGVTGANGSKALVFQGGSGAIKASPVSYDLAAPAKALVTGRLDDS